MGGGMGIAAGDGHAWLSQPKLRSNHVHDALTTTTEAVQGDAMALAVAFQGAEHLLRQRVGEGPGLACGGNDVIHRRHGALRAAHRKTLVVEGSESLRAGDLVDQMQTDQQLGGTTRKIRHTVQFPDLVVKRAAAHSGPVISASP